MRKNENKAELPSWSILWKAIKNEATLPFQIFNPTKNYVGDWKINSWILSFGAQLILQLKNFNSTKHSEYLNAVKFTSVHIVIQPMVRGVNTCNRNQ